MTDEQVPPIPDPADVPDGEPIEEDPIPDGEDEGNDAIPEDDPEVGQEDPQT
jgi:hypothetical protein